MTENDQQCQHLHVSFDRTECACGWMHYYCDDCGAITDDCSLD